MRALRAGAASTIAIGLVATCLLGLLWYAVQQSERTPARFKQPEADERVLPER